MPVCAEAAALTGTPNRRPCTPFRAGRTRPLTASPIAMPVCDATAALTGNPDRRPCAPSPMASDRPQTTPH